MSTPAVYVPDHGPPIKERLQRDLEEKLHSYCSNDKCREAIVLSLNTMPPSQRKHLCLPLYIKVFELLWGAGFKFSANFIRAHYVMIVEELGFTSATEDERYLMVLRYGFLVMKYQKM